MLRTTWLLLVLALAGCTAPSGDPSAEPPGPSISASESASQEPTPSPYDKQTTEPSTDPTSEKRAVRFRPAAAMDDVRTLAGRIGPRLATGPGFRAAGDVVARRFKSLGYDVQRQSFPVPAGDSWGVPVAAGRSSNVVATPRGLEDADRHRVVGAHLDTVAVAPGAEDNASGVAILLELARLAAREEPRVPTVFVAFGAEEPRGPGDALHHFGSQHYVALMSPTRRASLRAMVSLDRSGVGGRVPVCTGPLSPPVVQNRLLGLASAEKIPALACENTASDHWSFEKAGFPVARLGSTPYAAYHSAADVPAVVNPRQLHRTGRLAWAWLSG